MEALKQVILQDGLIQAHAAEALRVAFVVVIVMQIPVTTIMMMNVLAAQTGYIKRFQQLLMIHTLG